jgi:hypothetical protein
MKKPTLLFLVLPSVGLGQVSLTPSQIAKRVSPSVVVIEGKTDSGSVLGSGFIVSKDGKLVTNLHVIRDLKSAQIQVPNGDVFDSVAVLATDERRDLAVLQIAGFDLATVDLGNSDTVNIGEPVIVLGSPRGLEGTVTAGILSSVRDTGEGFKVLQTDAAVNPGNSGGPMVNSKGQAIGVVSFKLRSSEGLNFAIPINYLRGLLNNLHDPITLDQMRRDLSTSATASNSRSDPTLKETLGWLKEHIPLGILHGSFKFEDAAESRTEVVTNEMKVWSLDSCTATVSWEGTTIFSNRPRPQVMIFRYSFPISAIDGGSIEKKDWAAPEPSFTFLGGDKWVYLVHLESSTKGIISQGYVNSQPDNFTSGPRYRFTLDFPDESLAQRVLRNRQ